MGTGGSDLCLATGRKQWTPPGRVSHFELGLLEIPWIKSMVTGCSPALFLV